jgi:hypothetical protein
MGKTTAGLLFLLVTLVSIIAIDQFVVEFSYRLKNVVVIGYVLLSHQWVKRTSKERSS